LADSEKTLARFKAEATIFLGAGTETTAAALTTITYYVTANPDIRKKLISELKTHQRSSLVELEALPYLVRGRTQ
jgi:cytochrome P450